jgi:Uma2 family endonuclease
MSLAEHPAEAPVVTMTFDEFMALPDDGVRRELIRGELRVRGMTIRNRFHAEVESAVAEILRVWRRTQPSPRGKVMSGEVGFRLRGAGDTAVGIDVAYVSPEMASAAGQKQLLFEGPPVLAVEIVSPSDTFGDVADKVDVYLEVGTVCWVIDYKARTVVIHRPGIGSQALDDDDELLGDPYLPGFRARVADFFE